MDDRLIQGNPWGFHVNISHPQIRRLYERYKASIGEPIWAPLSDGERMRFESYILPLLAKEKEKATDRETIPISGTEKILGLNRTTERWSCQ